MKHTHVFQRREKILQILRHTHSVSVGELADMVGASDWTIRRDLMALEEAGQVRRHHGGAELTLDTAVLEQMAFDPLNQALNKVRIGRTAARLISAPHFIALAAGTTTTQVALALCGRVGLSIMTNALNIAQDLSRESGIQVSCAGGQVHGDYFTLTGPITERALSTHYYDLAVIGVSGISAEKGYTVNSQSNAAAISIMLRNAHRRMVVADHTKFGRVSYAFLAGLGEVHVLVTDQPPPADLLRSLQSAGVQLVIAED